MKIPCSDYPVEEQQGLDLPYKDFDCIVKCLFSVTKENRILKMQAGVFSM